MTFTAIMAATQDNRIAKRMDFLTEAEADLHVAAFLARFPDAFVVPTPSGPEGHWLLDMTARPQTLTIVPPPPPDFDAIDQATVEGAFNLSGMDRAELRLIFELIKAMKTGNQTFFASVTSVATFKELVAGMVR